MITREAYNLAREYVGLKEVPGKGNAPEVALAHHLCGLSILEPTTDVDSTIPWCSSWVNLCLIGANARINPAATRELLTKKGFNQATVHRVFQFAKVPIEFRSINTQLPIYAPTWSANSKSWDTWGRAIPIEHAQRGDLLRLTRDGGGHICWLDEDTPGKVMLTVFGGNQSNQVCSSNLYARTRLVHVRRI